MKECYHKSGFCYFVYMILNNVFNSTPCKGLASDIYLYDILYVYEDPNLHIMYFCDVLNYLYVMRVWAYSAFLHIRNNSKTPKDLKVFQDKWYVYFSGKIIRNYNQIVIIIRNLNDFFIEKVSHHVIQEYGTKATTHACTVHYPQM